MNTSNPAFGPNAFQHPGYDAPAAATMTVQGAISKTFLLLAILSATAIWSYSETTKGDLSRGVLIGSLIGGTVFALITIFKPTLAPWTSPVYAALEGVFLGAVSSMADQVTYKGVEFHGIAIQAVGLTAGTLFVMLTLYVTRTIRVTDKLRGGIIAATGAICLVYMLTWVLGMFGISIPFIHQGGTIGIVFSLFVVGLAAFNLLLDFDMIEKGAAYGAPKSMEWYGAFGLMVTLVWLYLEVLRLLSKLNGGDRR